MPVEQEATIGAPGATNGAVGRFKLRPHRVGFPLQGALACWDFAATAGHLRPNLNPPTRSARANAEHYTPNATVSAYGMVRPICGLYSLYPLRHTV